MFDGYMDFNYEINSPYSAEGPFKLQNSKDHYVGDVLVFSWHKSYIRGVDDWYYLKVLITFENLRGA